MQLDDEAFGKALADRVRNYVARATEPLVLEIAGLKERLASIPPGPQGEPGRDADPLLIRTLVADAVAALPPPRDGRDGVGVASGMIDRSGVLILTLSDGTARELGVVVGRDGAPGERGEKGDQGEKGLDGKDGQSGRDGVDGKDGAPGARGETGPQGESGEKGAAGERGDPGHAGERGLDGVDGRDGINGKDGSAGVDGKDGRDGLDGKDGAPGADGQKGEDGQHGRDGADGINGKDGAPGLHGKDGRDGIDGRDGSPGSDGQKGDVGQAGKDGRDGVDGQKGDPGQDGIGLADAMIDREGNLVITTSDGRAKSLGVVVGRDAALSDIERLVTMAVDAIPRPRDGVDGKDGASGSDGRDGFDGFGLDDFDTELRADGRTVAFKFIRGDVAHVHEVAFPVAIYRGVHEMAKQYEPGDMVTWGGSLWHCNAPTMEKPGDSSNVWTLCVKRGRDGKDISG